MGISTRRLAELRGFSPTSYIAGSSGMLRGGNAFTAQVLIRQLGPSSVDQFLCGNVAGTRGWSLVRLADTSTGSLINLAFTVYENNVAQVLIVDSLESSYGKFVSVTVSYDGNNQNVLINGTNVKTAATSGAAYNLPFGLFSIGYDLNNASDPATQVSILGFAYVGSAVSDATLVQNHLEMIKRQEPCNGAVTWRNLYSVARDAGFGVPAVLRNGVSLLQQLTVVGRSSFIIGTPDAYLGDATTQSAGGGGGGDVSGPGSSTNNAVARWDGPTGTQIKNSVVIVDNSGNIDTPGSYGVAAGTRVAELLPASLTFDDTAGGTTFEIKANPVAQIGVDGVSLGLTAQDSDDVPGDITFQAGSNTDNSANGGVIVLRGGAGVNTGYVVLESQPSGLGINRTALQFADNTGDLVGFVAPATVVTPTLWSLPNADGTSGQALVTNGASALSWVTISGSPTGAAGGDLSGTYPNPVVAKLQTVNVSAVAPTNGQVLTYNSGATQWEATTPSSSPTGAAGGDLAGTYPNPTVARINTRAVVSTLPTNGQVLTWNTVGVTWEPQTPSGSPTGAAGGDLSGTYPNPTVARINTRAVVATLPTNGQVLTWNTIGVTWEPATPSTSPTGAAGGDLSGTYPNPTVARLQTVNVSAVAPTNTQVLTYNSGTTQWEAATPSTSPTGAAGGDLSGTYPNPTVARINTRAVVSTLPTNGQVLTWNAGGTTWEPQTPATVSLQSAYNGGSSIGLTDAQGDIAVTDAALTSDATALAFTKNFAGSLPAITVTHGAANSGVSLRSVLTTFSSTFSHTAIQYNNTAGGSSFFIQAAAAQTGTTVGVSVAISGQTVANAQAGGVTLTGGDSNTLAGPISGIAGSGAGIGADVSWQGGLSTASTGGNINLTGGAGVGTDGSVFLRALSGGGLNRTALRFDDSSGLKTVGFVAPTAIPGTSVLWTLPNADGTSGQLLSTNGTGTLSWTTPSTSPTGAAGGDLSGTYPNPTVARINTRAVAATLPTNGQVLTWNAGGTTWEPQTPASASLQSAYNGGSSIALSDAQGDIAISDAALTSDATALAFTKNFAGSLPTLTVSHGASNTGPTLRSTKGTAAIELYPSSIQYDDTASNAIFSLAPKNATAAAATGGTNILVTAQNGGTGANGGGFLFQSGATDTATAGNYTFNGGNASGAGVGGTFSFVCGTAVGGTGGTFNVLSGSVSGASACGAITFTGASHGTGAGAGGKIALIAGANTVGTGAGGNIELTGGRSTSSTDGSVLLLGIAAGGGKTALRFRELIANGTNTVGFVAPDSIASDVLWTLPNADGTASQGLVTDGAGALSWASFASSLLTFVAVAGTTKTVGLSDGSTVQECTNAAAVTITIPTNATTAFPIGTVISFVQEGAGQVTIAAAGGVTINTSLTLKTYAQWSYITIYKTATNTWNLIGERAVA